uniref:Uncharacterized protein n=1 Tax=Coturnix japonica TaxID=93934 RepID=A0A8C2SMG0_COTJA
MAQCMACCYGTVLYERGCIGTCCMAQCCMAQCCMAQCCMTQCCMARCCMAQCCMAQCCMAQCCMAQCSMAQCSRHGVYGQCCMAQCCMAQCSMAQCSMARCCMAQCSMAQCSMAQCSMAASMLLPLRGTHDSIPPPYPMAPSHLTPPQLQASTCCWISPWRCGTGSARGHGGLRGRERGTEGPTSRGGAERCALCCRASGLRRCGAALRLRAAAPAPLRAPSALPPLPPRVGVREGGPAALGPTPPELNGREGGGSGLL